MILQVISSSISDLNNFYLCHQFVAWCTFSILIVNYIAALYKLILPIITIIKRVKVILSMYINIKSFNKLENKMLIYWSDSISYSCRHWNWCFWSSYIRFWTLNSSSLLNLLFRILRLYYLCFCIMVLWILFPMII